MKLTNIALYSNNVEVANFSFRNPGSVNPYVAESIVGLDADEIVPKFYGVSAADSQKYHTLSLNKREIKVLVSLRPDYAQNKTHSDLRDDLYKAIASSRTGTIQLRFNNAGTTVAAISGFVTKFESPHFTKTPQVQMTIACDDSMLRALDCIVVDETYLGVTNTIVDPDSTAPHGFKFNMIVDEIANELLIRDFVVVDVDPKWSFEIIYDFLVDDELFFSSEIGDRYLYIIRGVSTIHLIDKITPGSMWPILFPGANDLQFDLTVTAGGVSGFSWGSMTYYPTYWGV